MTDEQKDKFLDDLVKKWCRTKAKTELIGTSPERSKVLGRK